MKLIVEAITKLVIKLAKGMLYSTFMYLFYTTLYHIWQFMPDPMFPFQLHVNINTIMQAMERQQQEMEQLRRNFTEQQESYLEVITLCGKHIHYVIPIYLRMILKQALTAYIIHSGHLIHPGIHCLEGMRGDTSTVVDNRFCQGR